MTQSGAEGRDQAWLEALAGRAAALDHDSGQAGALRQFLGLQTGSELAHAPDPEGEKRILNMLRLRGAFDPAPAPAAAPGLVKRALGWLFPSSGHRPGWSALAAMALLLLVLVPGQRGLDPAHDPAPARDMDGMKSLPEHRPPALPAAEAINMSAQPARDAERLVALLAGAGVTAQLRSDGPDVLVQATVPATRVAEVNQALAAEGHAVPDSGLLRVRFQELP